MEKLKLNCHIVRVILIAFALGSWIVGGVFAESYDVDSGFRPIKDGFSFVNYGEVGCSDPLCFREFPIVNLGVDEMVRLFGRSVCVNPDADESCALSKVAASWMENANAAMNNGHCEGLSILSALFYRGVLAPDRFGAPTVDQLFLPGNTRLQREIAYWYATQLLTETVVVEEDPIALLRTLILALRENPDRIIQLGLYRRDRQFGHTVSAYAIRDMGEGIFRVMVYDSNFPAIERFITIDVKTNSWQYLGSSLPTAKTTIYSGEGTFNPIRRIEMNEKLDGFHCEFCPTPEEASDAPVRIVTNGKTDIFIADETGKKAGVDWKTGESFDELPGVTFRQILGTNSAVFPRDQQYFFWLNSPNDQQWQRFHVSLTEPGSILTLTNVLESYEYPTLTYRPADPDANISFESFDVLASPNALPEISYVVANQSVEARIAFQPEAIGNLEEVPNLNIFLFHDESIGTIAIEVYPAKESEASAAAEDFSLRFNGRIELYQGEKALTAESAAFLQPVEIGLGGRFTFNYLEWGETGRLRFDVLPSEMGLIWTFDAE